MLQRRWEVWPERNLSEGALIGDEVIFDVGEVEVAVVEVERVEVSESVLDWRERRRKGMEGRRKVGKRVGVRWGSEGLRRKDIAMLVRI